MKTQYDYQKFIELCHKMYEGIHVVPEPYVNMSLEDWTSITHKAIKSVKQRLYEFNYDKQRKFFIQDLFENIFIPINNEFFFQCFSYADNDIKIKKYADKILKYRATIPSFNEEPEYYVLPWDRYFLDNKSALYISFCTVHVSTFTNRVSELCFEYGIKFEEIANKVMIYHHEGDIVDYRSGFYYKISTGAYMDGGVLENYELNVTVNEPANVIKQPEMSDLFCEQYKDNYKLFLEILKFPPLNFVSEENNWIGNYVDCYHFFKTLQSKSIIESNIRTAQAARLFNEAFKVSKPSFEKGPGSTISNHKQEIFSEAIDQVLSNIRMM